MARRVSHPVLQRHGLRAHGIGWGTGRSGRPGFKYIHYVDLEDVDELYDLETDPNEMSNLIDSGEHAEIRAQMEARLDELYRP